MNVHISCYIDQKYNNISQKQKQNLAEHSLCVLVGDMIELVLELGDHRMGLVYLAKECDDGLREVPNLLMSGLELFAFNEQFL